MKRTKAERDAETEGRVERSTAFIKWLWDRLEGDEVEKTVVMAGVLDRLREVRSDALADAAGMAEQVLEMRPGSEPLKLTVAALRDYANLHRQMIEGSDEGDAS